MCTQGWWSHSSANAIHGHTRAEAYSGSLWEFLCGSFILSFIFPGLFLDISRFHSRTCSRFVVYRSLLCASTSALVSVCVFLCVFFHGPLFCCVSSSFILVSVALRVLLRVAFVSRLCLQLCVPPARSPLLTFGINDLSLCSCAPLGVSSQHLEFSVVNQCELSVDSAINTFCSAPSASFRTSSNSLHGRLWHRHRNHRALSCWIWISGLTCRNEAIKPHKYLKITFDLRPLMTLMLKLQAFSRLTV